jgi:hypothetical protein
MHGDDSDFLSSPGCMMFEVIHDINISQYLFQALAQCSLVGHSAIYPYFSSTARAAMSTSFA